LPWGDAPEMAAWSMLRIWMNLVCFHDLPDSNRFFHQGALCLSIPWQVEGSHGCAAIVPDFLLIQVMKETIQDRDWESILEPPASITMTL